MSQSSAKWANLAARVVRCVLAKKDIGYSELSRLLSQFGSTEDEKALASRVALGRVRLSLLLQIFHVTDAEIPMLWQPIMCGRASWEDKAAAILKIELGQIFPMDIDELGSKLAILGVAFTHKTLKVHLESGNIFLPDFLKCLVILHSHSLDSCIDYKDLIGAARDSSTDIKE